MQASDAVLSASVALTVTVPLSQTSVTGGEAADACSRAQGAAQALVSALLSSSGQVSDGRGGERPLCPTPRAAH